MRQSHRKLLELGDVDLLVVVHLFVPPEPALHADEHLDPHNVAVRRPALELVYEGRDVGVAVRDKTANGGERARRDGAHETAVADERDRCDGAGGRRSLGRGERAKVVGSGVAVRERRREGARAD